MQIPEPESAVLEHKVLRIKSITAIRYRSQIPHPRHFRVAPSPEGEEEAVTRFSKSGRNIRVLLGPVVRLVRGSPPGGFQAGWLIGGKGGGRYSKRVYCSGS